MHVMMPGSNPSKIRAKTQPSLVVVSYLNPKIVRAGHSTPRQEAKTPRTLEQSKCCVLCYC